MQILMVVDEPRVAGTLATSLVQQGYAVDVVRSADEADEVACVERHDLIIVDVGGCGPERCRSLRRHKVAAPVLMLAASHATEDKIAGLDAGADAYLTKPFQSEELMARLRSMLRRSQATESVVLRLGDLVMNLDEHQVSLAGIRVKLSAKEFALLEYMMRNPRKLLTRTMICESVWDMNYEASSNVIDVRVSSLRRKIDRDRPKPRIETVTGSGYRFLPQADDDKAPSPPTATDAAAIASHPPMARAGAAGDHPGHGGGLLGPGARRAGAVPRARPGDRGVAPDGDRLADPVPTGVAMAFARAGLGSLQRRPPAPGRPGRQLPAAGAPAR